MTEKNMSILTSDILNAFFINELSLGEIIELKGFIDLYLMKRLLYLDKDFETKNSKYLYKKEK